MDVDVVWLVQHVILRSAMLMNMHDRHKQQLEEEKKCWKETIMFVESYLKLPQVWYFSDKDQNTLTKEVPVDMQSFGCYIHLCCYRWSILLSHWCTLDSTIFRIFFSLLKYCCRCWTARIHRATPIPLP